MDISCYFLLEFTEIKIALYTNINLMLMLLKYNEVR